MRRAVLLATLVAGSACAAAPAAAQTLRGVVRDSASGQPIAGAVVMLLDSSGTIVARNISSERGQYRVTLAGAARALRVVRIGFQPRELPLPPAERASAFDFGMLPVTTMLAAVRVADKSKCPARPDEAATFGLWEQVRAGLLATVVAEEGEPRAHEASRIRTAVRRNLRQDHALLRRSPRGGSRRRIVSRLVVGR